MCKLSASQGFVTDETCDDEGLESMKLFIDSDPLESRLSPQLRLGLISDFRSNKAIGYPTWRSSDTAPVCGRTKCRTVIPAGRFLLVVPFNVIGMTGFELN